MDAVKRTGQGLRSAEGCRRGTSERPGGDTVGWRGRGGLTNAGPGNPIPLGPRGASSPAAAARRAAARSPAAAARAEPEKDRGSGHGGEGGREGGSVAERPGTAEQPWVPGCRAPREPRSLAGVGGARAASPADTAADDVSRRLCRCFAGRARGATGPAAAFLIWLGAAGPGRWGFGRGAGCLWQLDWGRRPTQGARRIFYPHFFISGLNCLWQLAFGGSL